MSADVRGRVIVRTRALERVFAALAADALGVDPRAVHAQVADEQVRLRVVIVAPVAEGRGPSVIGAAARARERIAQEGPALTGATLGTVTVRISGIAPTSRRTT